MSALEASLDAWQRPVLSILRLVAGLLFLQHGLVKLASFPMSFPNPISLFSMLWFAGAIEIAGGALLVLGLFTRWVVFICSGQMAFAYFIGHAPKALIPIENGGNLAILYCFVFFYLVFAGPGPWSLDARRSGKA